MHMLCSIFIGVYFFVVLFKVLEYCLLFFCFFFFKQKTAYEMRISDWSSDVCSSDLCMIENDKVNLMIQNRIGHFIRLAGTDKQGSIRAGTLADNCRNRLGTSRLGEAREFFETWAKIIFPEIYDYYYHAHPYETAQWEQGKSYINRQQLYTQQPTK